jgi:hypothetical protein
VSAYSKAPKEAIPVVICSEMKPTMTNATLTMRPFLRNGFSLRYLGKKRIVARYVTRDIVTIVYAMLSE